MNTLIMVIFNVKILVLCASTCLLFLCWIIVWRLKYSVYECMQIIRYLMVGGIASIVDIGLFVLFAKFIGYNYILVAACSFVIATGVNYQLSVRHVFESTIRHTRKKEVLLVYFVSLVGLLINLIILYLAVSIFLFEMVLSKIFASGLVFFWNYFIRKYYIF